MTQLRHLIHSVLAIGLALLAFAAIGYCSNARAEALTIGLHTVSYHAPERAYLHNTNPGIYARLGSWQGGVFRNSYDRTSVYGGAVVPLWSVDLMLGVATGYDKRCSQQTTETVEKIPSEHGTATRTWQTTTLECKGWSRYRLAPLAALSWAPKVDVLGARPRLWFMPGIGSSSTVHLSLEWAR